MRYCGCEVVSTSQEADITGRHARMRAMGIDAIVRLVVVSVVHCEQ